ncbi:MAG: helix-turn-helix domain-containing protein, partial [Actinobacteria bacterium]|nr:helix-turn-helix domain-containing protein [Actinomycetota bacterium]
VRRQHLQAIEADEFDRLPGDTFARGFIRIYAGALGLDSEPLIAAYVEQTGLPGPDYGLPTPTLAQVPVRRIQATLVGIGVVVALLLLTVALCNRPSGEAPPSGGGPPAETVRAEAQIRDRGDY